MRDEQGLEITGVQKDSRAAAAGICSGDRLISVNGHQITDPIDFHFYTDATKLSCVLLRGGVRRKVTLRPKEDEAPGLEFAPMRFRTCGNHCQFCFIDQNPPGLRRTLYVKDEDFRLSFLYGNYVTLTRTTEKELARIIEQRLSPLYVSVHAVDADVRGRLLGLKKDDHLIDKLQLLAANGIEMHTQIVLCPGINDGEVLNRSVRALAEYYPSVRSLAIVPVGLTAHRQHLPQLRSFDSGSAARLLEQTEALQAEYLQKTGEPFVYCADEFYLLASRPLPSEEQYGFFWQTDNGVGLTREFLSAFAAQSDDFPAALTAPARYVLVTGMLAAPVLAQHVIPVLERIGNLRAEVLPVENRLYGSSVTVSGLLCGRDILAALEHLQGDYTALLPSSCVNADGVLLDDMTPAHIAARLGRTVRVVDDFAALWEQT